MKKTLRVLSILVGAMFLVQALRWLWDPGAAAEALGMELLTGVGASTQIGDIGAFFLSIAIISAGRDHPGATTPDFAGGVLATDSQRRPEGHGFHGQTWHQGDYRWWSGNWRSL